MKQSKLLKAAMLTVVAPDHVHAGVISRLALLLLVLPAVATGASEGANVPTLPSIIPIIDAKHLFNRSSAGYSAAQEKLGQALEISGFMVLRNTAITPEVVADIISAYQTFFEQPVEYKRKVDMSQSFSNRGWGHPGAERVSPLSNPDYKEFFDRGIELPAGDPLTEMRYYAPNMWPDIPGFKESLDAYFLLAHGVARQLLSAVAESLGQGPGFLDGAFAAAPMSLLRGRHYPPRPEGSSAQDFGIAPHTDYGCVTLVVSDSTPGLEVLTPAGEWLPVTPARPSDVVVNFGDMLEMWSGGLVKATVHRVRGSEAERFSSAFFFNPSFGTDVSPVLTGRRSAPPAGEAPLLRSVKAGEYLSKRYDDTYVHLTINEQGANKST